MRIVNISDEDRASFGSLQSFTRSKSIKFESGMDQSESLFLITLMREKAPKKVLEVGVATGSSSVVLLHALANTKNTKLYSIDYSTQLYEFHSSSYAPEQHATDLKTGYLVSNYPHLQKKWQLFTGGLACNFLDKIGGDIDFCLIDTMHRLPGEVLDFLMIFPYLKDDATLILHDTNLQTMQNREIDMSNNLLISALSGTKLIQQENKKHFLHIPFPNIAGVELKNQKDALWDIFNLLALPWSYMPDDSDIELLRAAFQKHYRGYFVKMFDDIIPYQKRQFQKQQEKQNRLIVCKECMDKHMKQHAVVKD